MTALITGASSGIGRDIARLLAQKGIDLILVARRKERLEELGQELPVKTEIIACDLAKEENCRALYAQLRERQIDILINNAGFALFGRFDQLDLDGELAMIDTNIRAVHILTKLFLRDFKQRDSGCILNVASSAGYLPGPQMAAYYATKSYVLRLTQAIHEELAHDHSRVKITAFCPGPVSTEFDAVAGSRFRLPSLSSERAAEAAVKGMFRGKTAVIPGAIMKTVRFLEHLVPDRVLMAIGYHMQRPAEK